MNQYPEKVYLNGEIIDAQSAKISVFDRGFLLRTYFNLTLLQSKLKLINNDS